MPRYEDVVLIVEGWSDHDQLQLAYPGIETIVIYGTRVVPALCTIRNAIMDKKRVFIMTDPDKTGDWSAKAIQKAFPKLVRVEIDPGQSRSLGNKGWHYGVEYCSVEYLRYVLDPILSGDYLTFPRYLGVDGILSCGVS